MNTICHNCHGAGFVLVKVMAVSRDGRSGEGYQQVPCRLCDGKGKLPGMVPPA